MDLLVVLTLIALTTAVVALGCAWRERAYFRSTLSDLKSKVDEAERRLRLRGDLANEVAHEIKNPISAILCSAETLDLLIGDSLEPDHRKSLRYILEYSDSVLRMLSDFLDVSRAEAGLISSYPEPTDVRRSVESVFGLLRSFAMRKRIELYRFEIERDVEAYVDPRLLKQILFNLMHNAIKFTPAGGELRVTVAEDLSAKIVSIDVSDSGEGIDADLLPKLFDPYTKGAQKKRAEVGTGLGLAVVKALVERSGGSITVNSRPGEGTTFRISLPLYLRSPQSVALQFVDSKQPRSDDLRYKPLLGQSFLLVHDEGGTRDAMSALIQAWGGAVDQVGEATAALQALSSKRYDAVMVDDGCNGGNGRELVRTLREDRKADQTTLILASSDRGEPGMTEQSGIDTVIEKPINGRVLLQSLLAAVRNQITH